MPSKELLLRLKFSKSFISKYDTINAYFLFKPTSYATDKNNTIVQIQQRY